MSEDISIHGCSVLPSTWSYGLYNFVFLQIYGESEDMQLGAIPILKADGDIVFPAG